MVMIGVKTSLHKLYHLQHVCFNFVSEPVITPMVVIITPLQGDFPTFQLPCGLAYILSYNSISCHTHLSFGYIYTTLNHLYLHITPMVVIITPLQGSISYFMVMTTYQVC